MRVRVDIGINSQCDWRADALRSGDSLDRLEFLFALYVEAADTLLQSVFDFVTRFTDPGKCALVRLAARGQHTEQLATGNDVEAGACPHKQFHYSVIRVRLYRITNQAIQRRERGVESRVMIEDCPRAVDICRRTECPGNPSKIDVFATKMTIAITK